MKTSTTIAIIIGILFIAPVVAQTTNSAQNAPTVVAKTSTDCADGMLQARLQTLYMTNPMLNRFNINVEVANNVANLSGTLQNTAQRDLAISIARDVDGIQDVKSDINIDPNTTQGESNTVGGFFQKISDATLTAAVKTKLLATTNVSSMDINVTTVNSVVTLTGTVATAKEKKLAGQTAIKTMGVTSVKNQLRVGSKR